MAMTTSDILLPPRLYYQIGTHKWLDAINEMGTKKFRVVQTNYELYPIFPGQLSRQFIIHRLNNGKYLCETNMYIYWTMNSNVPDLYRQRPDYVDIFQPFSNYFGARICFLDFLFEN